MTTQVLERPIVQQPTESGSEEETQLAETSGYGNSGLIIVENPLVRGYTGFLVSRAFRRQPYEVELFDVGHYRVPEDKNPAAVKLAVKLNDEYERLTIRREDHPVSHVRVITDSNVTLNCPSRRPYGMSLIQTGQHDTLKRMLGDEETFLEGAEMALKIAAENSPIFQYRNGRLLMPRDYASFRIR